MKAAILWLIGSLASLSTCSLMCYLGERLDLWWRGCDSFTAFPLMAFSFMLVSAVGIATFFLSIFCLVGAAHDGYKALKQTERFKQL